MPRKDGETKFWRRPRRAKKTRGRKKQQAVVKRERKEE